MMYAAFNLYCIVTMSCLKSYAKFVNRCSWIIGEYKLIGVTASRIQYEHYTRCCGAIDVLLSTCIILLQVTQSLDNK